MPETLDETANNKRTEAFAINQSKFGYNETVAYSESHGNALSDGDEKGKGNPAYAGGLITGYAAPAEAEVGSSVDMEKRTDAIAMNQGTTGMSPDTPYSGPTLNPYPYQTEV
jgi:hypothetical protein